MSDPNPKLQRLLAQQRALSAQIKSLENRERDRDEKAISLLIRRHKLTRFPTEKLNEVFTRVIADLETNVTSEQEQPQDGMGQTNAG